MKGKVNFVNDILEINMREISFEFFGFKSYKIDPPVVSVPSRYIGFDVYISGTFNHELSVLVCYKKISENQYEMVKLYELSSPTHRNTPEAEMAARYFQNNYLVKKCGYDISTIMHSP